MDLNNKSNPKLIDDTINSIIELLPLRNELIDLKKIYNIIDEIINDAIKELSKNIVYLNGEYTNDVGAEDKILEIISIFRSKIMYSIFKDTSNINYYENISDNIDIKLYTFFHKIQPILKELDIERRKEVTSKYLLRNLVNLSSEY